MLKKLSVLLAVMLALSAPAFSQMGITGINWEISRLQGKNRGPFVPVSQLRAAPEARFTGHLRALVALKNPSARAAEGLVLRYALSLRLLKVGEPPEKAFWGVPYFVEEVRVSKVGSGSEYKAKVIRFELQSQLNKLRGSGFTPVALKLEVMLAPRQGDVPAEIMREAVIEIVKP